jgi:hypothetical protein
MGGWWHDAKFASNYLKLLSPVGTVTAGDLQ